MSGTQNATIFSKAVTLIEYEKSGNPQEKYRPGGKILALFLAQSLKSGKYTSYIDQVLQETKERFRELEQDIEICARATFTLSLEHADPEAYRRNRMLEELEEDEFF